jgi:hypothetical protein
MSSRFYIDKQQGGDKSETMASNMVFITKKNCKLGMKSKDIRPGAGW